jgi:hypothetical protein
VFLDLKEKYTLEQTEHLGVQASNYSNLSKEQMVEYSNLSKEQMVEIGRERISSKAYPMLQTSIVRKSSTAVSGDYFQFIFISKGRKTNIN